MLLYPLVSGSRTHGGAFGLGEPNVNFAQYFTGNSYLNPLTNPKETVFVANVTFEPGCRKLAYPSCEERRRPASDLRGRRGLVPGGRQTRQKPETRRCSDDSRRSEALARGKEG